MSFVMTNYRDCLTFVDMLQAPRQNLYSASIAPEFQSFVISDSLCYEFKLELFY